MVLDASKGRRDEFEPYFKDAKPDKVVVVLKAREPARIMIAIGDKTKKRWHLQIAERWVVPHNFHLTKSVSTRARRIWAARLGRRALSISIQAVKLMSYQVVSNAVAKHGNAVLERVIG